jgi:hypothetical protein
MRRQFLPASVEPYISNEVRAQGWTAQDNGLLSDIATKMGSDGAITEGRLPSPFSRAFQFHSALHAHSGPKLQAQARVAFRGLSALFAFRQQLKLDLRLRVTPPLEGPAAVVSPCGDLLKSHLRGTPPAFAPLGQFAFIALQQANGIATVLAGLSPLTCFFPAARALPSSLKSILFWYDFDEGKWKDPTAVEDTGSHFQRRDNTNLSLARRLLHVWLRGVLHPDRAGQTLAQKMEANDRRLVLAEWQTWLEELEHDSEENNASVTVKPFTECGIREDQIPFPFLLIPSAEPPPIVSDLLKSKGVYLVTKRLLEDQEVQLSRGVFGSGELAARWDSAPIEGPNLGVALGREEWFCALPYVLLDKLFTPILSDLVDTPIQADPPPEWFVLRDKAEGAKASPASKLWLYPFAPQILKYLSADELRANTELLRAEVTFSVRLQLPGKPDHARWHVTKHYHSNLGTQAELDSGFDLRVFPSFDLRSVPNIEIQLPRLEDRRYFARLRLSPDSEKLSWEPLVGHDRPDEPLLPAAAFEAYSAGSFTPRATGGNAQFAEGKDRFWVFRDLDLPPGGLSVKDRGLLLLRLGRLDAAGSPLPWKIGIDFGTANSCVAYEHGAGPTPLSFPILTTSLLPTFFLRPLKNSNEGASAMLDFPYWRQTGEGALSTAEYFPSQIVTRLNPDNPAGLRRESFDLRNGLIFFRNISQVALEEPLTTPIIHAFPSALPSKQAEGVVARFYLKDRIKWEKAETGDQPNRRWRGVLHQHLRLQILLTAIRDHAYVSELTFSYPRAFDSLQIQSYQNAMKAVWMYDLPESGTPHFTIAAPVTESAAAARYLKVERGVDETVLDIGGGTTDLTVFSDHRLDAETSLRFAADTLDDYVLASPLFRAEFCKAFSESSACRNLSAASGRNDNLKNMEASFASGGTKSPEVLRCTWYGLLNLLLTDSQDQGSGLREVAQELRSQGSSSLPIYGFFTTAVFLFSGLAYFAGMMDRHRRREQTGDHLQNRPLLSIVGNGGRYIHLLSSDDPKPWCGVLGELFSAGADRRAPIDCRGLHSNPKAAIALGLVSEAKPNENRQGGIYDAIDSTSFRFSDQEIPGDLYAFYHSFVDHKQQVSWAFDETTPFANFLRKLDQVLPNGTSRTHPDLIVLPNVTGQSDWAQALAREALDSGELAGNINKGLRDNASLYQTALEKNERSFSVEPLFVTELIALLRYIRKTHATV